jgi:hypothetical protein
MSIDSNRMGFGGVHVDEVNGSPSANTANFPGSTEFEFAKA